MKNINLEVTFKEESILDELKANEGMSAIEIYQVIAALADILFSSDALSKEDKVKMVIGLTNDIYTLYSRAGEKNEA